MDQKTWLRRNTRSLAGKTVVLTGATGGLGREISRAVLFCHGSLVLVTRDRAKAQAMTASLLREFPEGSIVNVDADLSDLRSVDRAAEILCTLPVDILIHNAGAYSIPRCKCDPGYDNVFEINFVSPYYLTKRLLPLLRERHGKVIAVGSIAHTYSKTDPKDVDFSGRSAASLVYGNSKRYLMFALSGLLRDSGVAFAIAHPGITFTNITAHYPPLIFAVIKEPMKVIFMKPAAAARSIILAMFRPVPYLCWIGPAGADIWGNPAVKKLSTCSQQERRRIFRTAEAIYSGLCRTPREKVQEMSSADPRSAV